MGAFGDILRSRRQELGYSLDQVEEETKIRKYYIKALEEENFTVLPARVYAIGFVRRYARFLSLNEEEAVDWFKEIVTPEEEHLDEETVIEENRSPLHIPWKNILGGIIFLVVAIWLGKAVVGLISEQVKQPVKPPVGDVEPNQPPTGSVSPAPSAPGGLEPPPSTGQPPTKPGSDEEPGLPAKPPSTPAAGEAENPQKVTLHLRATGKSWVSVYVDGQHAYAGIMNPNEETEFKGSKITINLGNAGGVAATLDGNYLGYLGASGAVVNKVFTAEP